jgi:hypothetical protein
VGSFTRSQSGRLFEGGSEGITSSSLSMGSFFYFKPAKYGKSE